MAFIAYLQKALRKVSERIAEKKVKKKGKIYIV
jgi:hypothetical protein